MSVLTRERIAARTATESDEHDVATAADPAAPRGRRARSGPAPVPRPVPSRPTDAQRLGWPGGRYGVVYRHVGSRAVAGAAWFAVGVAALVATGVTGSLSILAALFGFVAALAAYQSAASWRLVGIGANRLLAAAGGLAMGFAALHSPAMVGSVIVGLIVCALVDGGFSGSVRHAVAAASATVTSALAPGLAAAGMVFVADIEIYAAGCLFALVCFYDAGDYVNGSDRSPAEGPAWGIASALIVTFVFAMWNVPPFTATVPAWVFGGLAAVLCPLGQLVASAVLPAAGAPAPALRRLDSLVLAAPVWAWCLWSYVG